jgi:hypothetical protein
MLLSSLALPGLPEPPHTASMSYTTNTVPCHALQAKRVTKGIWNTTTRTLLSLYWAQLLYHSFWVAIEVGVR